MKNLFKKIKGKINSETARARQFLHKAERQKGFFLVELIVAIFIFSILSTISVGSLITALDSNRKAQSLKSVLNNLTVVLDTMTKNLAAGQYYNCQGVISVPLEETLDCPSDDPNNTRREITFLSNRDLGDDGEANDIITYRFDEDERGGYIERTIYIDNSGAEVGPIRMTAPEVNITDMRFYVRGSLTASSEYIVADRNQPFVTIVVQGEAPAGPRTPPTTFMVQTSISQRVPDFE
jgi:prepilin-type N-terminal cleavage/methylation domain-containing protein